MGIEVRPISVACNLRCMYCYQNPQRDAGNVSRKYDLGKIKAAVAAEGKRFSLFGGEPLLMPLEDLEDLWSWGYNRFGRNSLQTNGTLISADHVRLFRQYNVHVGISVDGPEGLNGARWHGSQQRTEESTRKTQLAIEMLCQQQLYPSLIITLTKLNASSDKLSSLTSWIRSLCDLGVSQFRVHLLESESEAVRTMLALSTEENIRALTAILELSREDTRAKFDLFEDIRNLLIGKDGSATCVWRACDPYTTEAVQGIEGDGHRSNCGRTNKDGIDFLKASQVGFERYVALYQTPQSDGGCQGCRFFLMCKGQCPGTAIDGDWRNRTEHCEVWKHFFSYFESELSRHNRVPLSLDPRLLAIENQAIQEWSNHSNARLRKLVDESDGRNDAKLPTAVA